MAEPESGKVPFSRFGRPVVVFLVVWNLAATALWLSEKRAWAEVPSCPGELAAARTALAEREKALAVLSQRLRHMARSNLQAMEQALVGTGIRLDTLLHRRNAKDRNRVGGPFVPATAGLAATIGEVDRWERAQRSLRLLPWGAPLRDYTVTSGFGTRVDPFNFRPAIHTGIDLVAPEGTKVRATAAGIVQFSGEAGGYGRMVEIDHGGGISTRYGHLSRLSARPGQTIAVGQVVGLLGSTGRSTGPHLHYEVVVEGIPRNPAAFLHPWPPQ
jgi:murein DD-endopeptidase MepM/ murein hydrolase activator NlpD